ncbi:hypothetical protein D3C75_1343710 [compost metagenome]
MSYTTLLDVAHPSDTVGESPAALRLPAAQQALDLLSLSVADHTSSSLYRKLCSRHDLPISSRRMHS